MRAMAFDVGLKRIGIAVTDSEMILATPHSTLPPQQIGTFLKEYVAQENVICFVIGKPLRLDGSASESAGLVKQFAEWLTQNWPAIPIDYIDERYTSSMAADTLVASGLKKQDRRNKSLLDSTAAALILQTWLSRRENKH